MSDQQVKALLATAVSSVGPDRLDVDAMVRGGRRRHRIRTVSTVGVAVGAIAVVAGVLFVVHPGGTVSATSPSASAAATSPSALATATTGEQSLAGWSVGAVPHGYQVSGRDSSDMAAVGPRGFHNDGKPTARDEVPVTVSMRLYESADYDRFFITVLHPTPATAGGGATEIAAQELVASMVAPSVTPVTVPGIPAGRTVLVRDNARSLELIVQTPQGDVIVVSANGPTEQQMVDMAGTLRTAS
jgi:hypothetical protein